MEGVSMSWHRLSMRLLAFAIAAGVALLAPSASKAAANLAPNPSFELNCAGIPCNWLSGTWDTTNPNLGAASIQLSAFGAGFFSFGVSSDCVSVVGTTYSFAAYYRTGAQDITQASLSASYWSSADCSTGPLSNTGGAFADPTTDDNIWRKITGSAAASVGAHSARLVLVFACSVACSANDTGNFDDVDMEALPTAVTLRSIVALRRPDGILVSWRTASETDVLGFNVYRLTTSGEVRVNARTVAAGQNGTTHGASYRVLDRGARAGASYRYRLEEVRLDGSTSWLGVVTSSR
jgi:hypothetical protein